MLFFTLVLVPLLNHHLRRNLARDLLTKLFPVYYHYNTGLAITAGIAAALSGLAQEAMAMAILGASFVFARTHLFRAIRALQPTDENIGHADLHYRLLHGVSTGLNFAQMAAAVWVLIHLLNG